MADAKASKKPGKAGFIIAMVVITVLAVGGGFGVGKMLLARLRPSAAVPVVAVASATAPTTAVGYSGDIEVKELPAIVTNLAGSEGTEVRLQVSIVYLKSALPNPAVMVAKIGDDMVAFLKTISLNQLQGASGLQNLRDDLNERASIRSQGAIREVIIETLATR